MQRRKTLLTLAAFAILPLASFGLQPAFTGVSSLPELRRDQADVWLKVRTFCAHRHENPSTSDQQACTAFADTVLAKSTAARMPMIDYMRAHAEEYGDMTPPAAWSGTVRAGM